WRQSGRDEPHGCSADAGPRTPRMSDAMSDDAILIIDDDPDLRDLVRLLAEGTNVDVVEAATCMEGIAALRANRDRVRLVLLDYFIPAMAPACSPSDLRTLTN